MVLSGRGRRILCIEKTGNLDSNNVIFNRFYVTIFPFTSIGRRSTTRTWGGCETTLVFGTRITQHQRTISIVGQNGIVDSLSVLDGELEEELDEEELDDEDRPDICFPAVASLSPVAHAVAG